MYDKKFWEKFIEEHGNVIDKDKNLIYIYTNQDLDPIEEETIELNIYTDLILEVKVLSIQEDENDKDYGKKYYDHKFYQMKEIIAVSFVADYF